VGWHPTKINSLSPARERAGVRGHSESKTNFTNSKNIKKLDLP